MCLRGTCSIHVLCICPSFFFSFHGAALHKAQHRKMFQLFVFLVLAQWSQRIAHDPLTWYFIRKKKVYLQDIRNCRNSKLGKAYKVLKFDF